MRFVVSHCAADPPRAMPGGGRTCRYVCVGCEVDGRRARKTCALSPKSAENLVVVMPQSSSPTLLLHAPFNVTVGLQMIYSQKGALRNRAEADGVVDA